MRKKRNEALNIVEAVAIIMVIFIHYPFPGRFGDIITAFARLSVPFYFTVSGYFYFKNKELPPWRQIRRLLLTVFISELSYFLYYFLMQVRAFGLGWHCVENVIIGEFWNYYVKELFVRLSVFAPVFNGVGWFMTSLIVVYLCFYLLKKWSLEKYAVNTAPLFIFGGIILRIIFDCLGLSIALPYERFLFLMPLPFFALGYGIHERQEQINHIKSYFYAIMALAGAVLTFFEQFFGNETLYFGTVLLVFSVFCLCIKHSDYTVHSLVGRFFSHAGAALGTFIYVMHMMIGNFVGVLCGKLTGSYEELQTVFSYLLPIAICMATVIAAEIFYWAKKIFSKKIARVH